MASRRALIVATGSYADPKLRQLRGPAADADLLAAVLRDPAIGDFEVDVALDESEASLRRRLARFFATAGRDDVLLTHFSCHGVKDARGALYLAASDTELDLLEATAIPAPWVDEQLTRSPSHRKLLLLDCCFSGKFPFEAVARAGESVDVHERFQGRGRAVITASNAMEYAYEGDRLSGSGTPSHFTAALIDALRTGEADRDQDSWISVDELYDYIYDRVRELSPNQTPTKQIALEGPLYVARSSFKRPVEPAQLDEQLLSLIEHPVTAARLGAVEELERLLASAKPAVSLAARNALERMRDDDSRRVAERAGSALAAPRAPEPAPDAPSPPVVVEPSNPPPAAPPPATRSAATQSPATQSPATQSPATQSPGRAVAPQQILASAGAVVLFASLLLPWFWYYGTGFWDSNADTGWHELPSVAVAVLVVSAAGGLSLPVVCALRPPGRRFNLAVAVLGVVSFLIVVYFGLARFPHNEQTNKYGVVVGLLGAGGLALGAGMSLLPSLGLTVRRRTRR